MELHNAHSCPKSSRLISTIFLYHNLQLKKYHQQSYLCNKMKYLTSDQHKMGPYECFYSFGCSCCNDLNRGSWCQYHCTGPGQGNKVVSLLNRFSPSLGLKAYALVHFLNWLEPWPRQSLPCSLAEMQVLSYGLRSFCGSNLSVRSASRLFDSSSLVFDNADWLSAL